ncbi:hypothetical protein EUTSA_v10002801mg, partial [Eutrema salsugineum]
SADPSSWRQGGNGKALLEPISKTVSELQSSLTRAKASGVLTSCNVLLTVEAEQAKLLDRGCFGRPVVCAENDKRWIQLTFEEAFFLFYNLKCIKISFQGCCLENKVELWRFIRLFKPNFATSYKAYSHLRSKNWIVRSGLQYEVDFVVYRHHPSLVHSEYAVVVRSIEVNDRLRVWSDIHCCVRLTGSVNGEVNREDMNLPVCLEDYTVEEHTVRRWSPELSREDENRT